MWSGEPRPGVAGGLAVAAAVATLAFLALFAAIPVPEPLAGEDFSRVVTDREGHLLRVTLDSREQVRLAMEGPLPATLRAAVLRYEDRRFDRHAGVSVPAVARALAQNLRAGRRVSGASTVTMQLARLAGGRPRTLGAKIVETLQALKIEALHDKETILRAYLDRAPYGGNVVGVRAASLVYFAKRPTELSWAEAAVLAVLPNAPGLVSPTRSPQELLGRRDRLLRDLHRAGTMDADALAAALAEPGPAARHSLPFAAPHAAEALSSAARRAGMPSRLPSVSTLDSGIQGRAEEIAGYHARSLASLGILGAAVVIAETGSGAVRAYLGSADYHGPQGQVDLVRAPRSTGSLLKPFLYALAMDEGLLLPPTVLQDVPTQFGAFAPTNADHDYRGLVTAREALILSLNVTAAGLLQDYGVERFYGFLVRAGLRGLFRPPEDYGLPLVLGGAEASLMEMAGLYRGLARGGRFAPLNLTEDGPVPASTSLISSGAAHLTLEILREVRRPGADALWQHFADGRSVAWKTGTSYGHKDAWAIGVTPEWTVAVWVGNPSGEGNPLLSGTLSAGPLLFDLFRMLPGDGAWFRPGPDILVPVRVWRRTGYRAPADATDVDYTLGPAGARPLPLCPYHRRLFVTLDGRYRVDAGCWPADDYRAETRFVVPVAVAQYLRDRGRAGDLPPPAPGCRDAGGVQLLYPQEGARVWIPRDLDGELQKVTLRAAHQEPGLRVYWYVDDVFHGTTAGRHALAVTLPRGEHRVEVVDDRGGRAARAFTVVGGGS